MFLPRNKVDALGSKRTSKEREQSYWAKLDTPEAPLGLVTWPASWWPSSQLGGELLGGLRW